MIPPRLKTGGVVLALVLAAAVLVVPAAYHLHRVQAARTWSKALARAVRTEPSALGLRDLPGPAWDRVHVFGPFTPHAAMTEALGFEWRGSAARTLERSDHVVLLVFVRNGNPVLTVLHPRDQGDFVPEAVGRAYAAGEAVFRVRRRAADGWLELEPASASTAHAHTRP